MLGDASDQKTRRRTDTSLKGLENATKPSSNYVLRRLDRADILSYASDLWRAQGSIAQAIASETVRIIHLAYTKAPSFFEDKNRKWILGGLFYLLGRRMSAGKTQKQIARCLGTSEMTIRKSYKKWLGSFPEFWPEATMHLQEGHDKRSEPSPGSSSKRVAKFL
jgi:hypothetical protein